jgi:hypothetical protein
MVPKIKLSEVQHRKREGIAAYCNLPYEPENWPIGILDRLIRVREQEGERALHQEVKKLFTP